MAPGGDSNGDTHHVLGKEGSDSIGHFHIFDRDIVHVGSALTFPGDRSLNSVCRSSSTSRKRSCV